MTFTDQRDGKTYKTAKIGEQVWLAENLSYKAEGSKIYNDNPANAEKYGLLYNWETARKACPEGWHLPANEEWQTLANFAGGAEIAGKKLKAANGWHRNGNGTDDFGFAALPGGSFYVGDRDLTLSRIGYWWSLNEANADAAFIWFMVYNREKIGTNTNIKSTMFSVRCVKD